MAAQKRDAWLTVIGVGKLIKMALLLVLGAGCVTLRGDDPMERATKWVAELGLEPGSRWVRHALQLAAGLDNHKLGALAAGCFVYAGLFAIEGGGLLAKKRWAEYVTIGITGSFVPLEIYEIVHHTSAGKIVALVLNLAALVYLVHHVRKEREEKRGASGSPRMLQMEGGARPTA